MYKVSIVLSCLLFVSSLRAMNYDVVGPVEREESMIQATESSQCKKIIIFSGFVKRKNTQELFAVTVEREFSPSFANPVLNRGRFAGIIAQIFDNLPMGSRQDLQLHEVSLLFSKLSGVYADLKIAEYAPREAERQALINQRAIEIQQRNNQQQN